uniref:Putative transporter n=1 Tax=Talaromyces marneffei PM1 TaxID=1077442 RepID=A0A093UUX2_TALMA
MALSTSFGGLLAARFFLGVTEAAQVRRVTLFYTLTSLAGAFGGILAYGIGHMSGVAGKHGWFWIFAIEGIAMVLIAGTSFFLIQDFPAQARFLSQRECKTLNALLFDVKGVNCIDLMNPHGILWAMVWPWALWWYVGHFSVVVVYS